MTSATLRLTEEQRLSAQFRFARLFRVELAEHVQLGCRREVQQSLELGHEVDLAAALQNADPLLGGESPNEPNDDHE